MYLNAEIVGESELIDGSKFILTELGDKIICLHFTLEGKAYVKSMIKDFMNQLKGLITLEESKNANIAPMCQERRDELEKELQEEKKKNLQAKTLINIPKDQKEEKKKVTVLAKKKLGGLGKKKTEEKQSVSREKEITDMLDPNLRMKYMMNSL